jgi:hypothetical protein
MGLWYVRGHRTQKAFSTTGRRRGGAGARGRPRADRSDETLNDGQVTAREMIVQFPDQKDGQ